LQKFKVAIEAINIAIKLNPNLPEAWYAKGNILKGYLEWLGALCPFNKKLEISREIDECYKKVEHLGGLSRNTQEELKHEC